MYNFAWSIIYPVCFIEFIFFSCTDTCYILIEVVGAYGIELFVGFSQQFRINGNFFFQRFIFADGKVVTVKNIENSVAYVAFFGNVGVRKKGVGKGNIGMYPVVIVDGIEKTAVEERDLTVETAVVIVVVTAIDAQRFVEKRFEYFVEKIGVVAILFFEQFA